MAEPVKLTEPQARFLRHLRIVTPRWSARNPKMIAKLESLGFIARGRGYVNFGRCDVVNLTDAGRAWLEVNPRHEENSISTNTPAGPNRG